MAAACCYSYTKTSDLVLHRRHRSSPFLGMALPYAGNSSLKSPFYRSWSSLKINAIFWGAKKTVEVEEIDTLLGSYTLTGKFNQNEVQPIKISISMVSSILDIAPRDWDACAVDATGTEKLNPFLMHAFLSSLEESGCAVKLKVSSLHVTFPTECEWLKMKDEGFLQRVGMQYHWKNRDYKNFDEFLMDMKQGKRKNIRQERKKISAQNLTMKRLRGNEIKGRHWDTFYKFYRSTTDNKWGQAYLTRDFFHNMGSKMGDRVLLVVAEEGDELVAGALNLIGGDTLYGRLWGCLPSVYYPSLHFEACYYQAIEAAIELNLSKVEAGAQGEHKVQRGYLPVKTYSSHYVVNEGFRKAIGDFLERETTQVKLVMELLHDSGPFKDGVH